REVGEEPVQGIELGGERGAGGRDTAGGRGAKSRVGLASQGGETPLRVGAGRGELGGQPVDRLPQRAGRALEPPARRACAVPCLDEAVAGPAVGGPPRPAPCPLP